LSTFRQIQATDSSDVASFDSNLRTLKNGAGNTVLDYIGNALLVAGTYLASNGAFWADATQKAFQIFHAGIRQTLVGVFFTQTATGTISNSTSELSLLSTGVGTVTIPANFFVAGKTIRIKGRGVHSTSGTPNLQIKVKLGSTIILDTGSVSSSASSNDWFSFEADITCRTAGASGTIMAQGQYTEQATGSNTYDLFAMKNTSTVVLDTTVAQLLDVTGQWAVASSSNSISLTNFTAEVLN
jgi:hypothetical protein